MEPVQVIRPDLVLVDWGPMTLTIAAWQNDEPRPVMAAQAARAALRCLAVLAEFQGYMRRRVRELPAGRPLPPVVERAARACRAIDGGLTPWRRWPGRWPTRWLISPSAWEPTGWW